MTETNVRYIVRRKSDGFFRKKARGCRTSWTDKLSEAQIFKLPSGCKHAVQSYLWEHQIPKDGKWVPSIKHPEWFDEKFEIVEVTIRISDGK